MSNIRIEIKKVIPMSEPCEVCHQSIDKTITVFRDKLEFTGDELDLDGDQFSALKQILLNASTSFMKALMETQKLEDGTYKETLAKAQDVGIIPKIPKGVKVVDGFTAVPPLKGPPAETKLD